MSRFIHPLVDWLVQTVVAAQTMLLSFPDLCSLVVLCGSGSSNLPRLHRVLTGLLFPPEFLFAYDLLTIRPH